MVYYNVSKDFHFSFIYGIKIKKPTWNFCKYLVNEDGDLVAFFDKSVKPLSKEITGLLYRRQAIKWKILSKKISCLN